MVSVLLVLSFAIGLHCFPIMPLCDAGLLDILKCDCNVSVAGLKCDRDGWLVAASIVICDWIVLLSSYASL